MYRGVRYVENMKEYLGICGKYEEICEGIRRYEEMCG